MFRFFLALSLLVLAFAPASPPASPQEMLITISKPFHSHSLAGTVLDPSGGAVNAVYVEECEDGWGNCFAHTRTAADGHFFFQHSAGGRHFLKFSKSGFQTTEIIVIVGWTHKRNVELRLELAT